MKKMIMYALAVAGFTLMNSCLPTKNSGMSNMIAIIQVDEPIPGVCDHSRVIAILPFPGNGQIKAQAPLTKEEIEKKLNIEVPFLKNNPEYNDKGMVNLIINCRGEMVRCEIDIKTKSSELDQQIVAVFSQLKKWEPGTVNGEAVDTSVLYSFEIKNGRFTI